MSWVDRDTLRVPSRSTVIIDRSPDRVRGPRPGTSSRPPTCSSTPRSFRSRFRRGPLLAKFFTSRPRFFFWGAKITGRQRVRGGSVVESTVDTPTRARRVRFSGQTNSVQGERTELPVFSPDKSNNRVYAERTHTHVDR